MKDDRRDRFRSHYFDGMYTEQVALSSFRQFMAIYYPAETEQVTCVADLVYHWLTSGSAASDCSFDYVIFMKAFGLIADQWSRDPLSFRYVLPEDSEYTDQDPEVWRRVDVIFNPASKHARLVFDADFFKHMCVAFQYRGMNSDAYYSKLPVGYY